jgi:hypothetical protein
MARIRTIKPEFFRHEELYTAERESGMPLRVAFAGLFTIADREGRFRWKPKLMKMDVLPWDDVDFELVLTRLVDFGFVKKYEVDGKTYGWIPSFTDHQVINNKESKSTFPEWRPDIDASFTRLSRVPHATLVEGKGREGREHKELLENLCGIFGREYQEPEDRLPAFSNWYRTIEHQASVILNGYNNPTEAAQQVKCYRKYCKLNNRKLIGTDHKAAETILSSDWVKLCEIEEVASKANPYSEATHWKGMLSKEAWEDKYSHKLSSDNEFRKAFGYEQLRNGCAVGSNAKS